MKKIPHEVEVVNVAKKIRMYFDEIWFERTKYGRFLELVIELDCDLI